MLPVDMLSGSVTVRARYAVPPAAVGYHGRGFRGAQQAASGCCRLSRLPVHTVTFNKMTTEIISNKLFKFKFKFRPLMKQRSQATGSVETSNLNSTQAPVQLVAATNSESPPANLHLKIRRRRRRAAAADAKKFKFDSELGTPNLNLT